MSEEMEMEMEMEFWDIHLWRLGRNREGGGDRVYMLK